MLRPAVTAVLLTASSVALADPPGETAPAPPPVESYRLQTAAADLTAVALLAAGLECAHACTNSGAPTPWFVAGIGVYLVGAPVIHGLHGRLNRAAGDFLVRAAPIALGLVIAGNSSCSSPDDDGCWTAANGRAYEGILVGSAGAFAVAVYDTWVLARGDEPRIAPVVTSSHGTTVLGFGGRF